MSKPKKHGIVREPRALESFNDWLRREQLSCVVKEMAANDWVAVVSHCSIRMTPGSTTSANGFGSTDERALEDLISKLKGKTLYFRILDGSSDDPERDIECPRDWDGIEVIRK